MGKKSAIEITDDLIAKAESLAASGLTIEEIAGCLGMGERTLYEKKASYPQLKQAISDGHHKGIGMMANNLVKLAKAGNAAANIFWLKARAKWRDGDERDQENPEERNKKKKEQRERAAKCIKKP